MSNSWRLEGWTSKELNELIGNLGEELARKIQEGTVKIRIKKSEKLVDEFVQEVFLGLQSDSKKFSCCLRITNEDVLPEEDESLLEHDDYTDGVFF